MADADQSELDATHAKKPTDLGFRLVVLALIAVFSLCLLPVLMTADRLIVLFAVVLLGLVIALQKPDLLPKNFSSLAEWIAMFAKLLLWEAVPNGRGRRVILIISLVVADVLAYRYGFHRCFNLVPICNGARTIEWCRFPRGVESQKCKSDLPIHVWSPFAEPAVDCRYDDKGTKMRAVPVVERNEIKCPPLTKRKLRISAPANGSSVDREAAAEVSALEWGPDKDDLPRTIWIVVHPMRNPAAQAYWVQPKLTPGTSGTWKGDTLLGDEGEHWTEPFEIRAFGDPYVHLEAGQILSSWPEAAWESDAITLRREPFVASATVTNTSVAVNPPTLPAPPSCPTSATLTANRIPGGNWVDVVIEARPEVRGLRYRVKITAPNGQVYLEREQLAPRSRVRLGDAATAGMFSLSAEVQGPRGCRKILSGNSVAIEVQPQGAQ